MGYIISHSTCPQCVCSTFPIHFSLMQDIPLLTDIISEHIQTESNQCELNFPFTLISFFAAPSPSFPLLIVGKSFHSTWLHSWWNKYYNVMVNNKGGTENTNSECLKGGKGYFFLLYSTQWILSFRVYILFFFLILSLICMLLLTLFSRQISWGPGQDENIISMSNSLHTLYIIPFSLNLIIICLTNWLHHIVLFTHFQFNSVHTIWWK